MILGNDISYAEDQVDFNIYKDNSNYVFIKASEGVNFEDEQFSRNQLESRRVGLPRGFYHYIRSDLGNTPEAEASWFLKTVGPLQEGECLALDYEISFSDPVGTCLKFLQAVYQQSTVKPLLYLNQSLVASHDWKPVADAGFGLWLAAYSYDPNKTNFPTGAWPFAAIFQWTDKQQVPGITGDVDGDVFEGALDQFKAYGYHTATPVPPVDPCADVLKQVSAQEDIIKGLQTQISTLTAQVLLDKDTIQSLHDQLAQCQTKPPVTIQQTFTKYWSKFAYQLAVDIEGRK